MVVRKHVCAFSVLAVACIIAVFCSRMTSSSTLSHPAKPSIRRPTLGMVGAKPTRRRCVPRDREQTRIRRMNAMDMGKVPAAIIAIQSLGLIGATVTGALAKRRRDEIHELNEKLRSINSELRARETSLIEKEAVLHYIEKQQYERARSEGAEAEEELHPEERAVEALIADGKGDVAEGDIEDGIQKFLMALEKADKLENQRYAVSSRRELSMAYKAYGNPEEALTQLAEALKIAEANGEPAIHSAVALYGEIADLYTDMGDLRRASEYYDKWIVGM